MRMVLAILLSAAAITSITGCSGTPERDKSELNQQSVFKGLEESTRAMSESLRILYELRNSQQFAHLTESERREAYSQANTMPESLAIPVTVNHHGDAEMLIRQVARMVRYKVELPLGRVPQDKPIVRINARARPAYDILRDVGSQVVNQMNIKVMPAENPNEIHRGVI